MARKVKCPICQKQLEKEDGHEYKKRYYHLDCFEIWRQETDDRNSLIDYIMELYNLDVPSPMMLKQIKDFAEEYKFKYKGMELALRYFHETLSNPVKEGTGIGIIPFVYEDAKKHYIQRVKVEETVDAIDSFRENKTVIVESPKFTYRKKVQQIDIGTL